jgi:hypothetical protein
VARALPKLSLLTSDADKAACEALSAQAEFTERGVSFRHGW